ncbi:GDSL-type esterase/lipase family protein [Flavihumibacter stibioxidans]|uniref:G-D-S-L family lipolytic protein n=1 Tax=Flavihumibacter stibioxidans TaxID=1834163 RepID=A0ABR7MBA4_9BACT|nr:GDSL-type esterase/lipase family protein [Flavihumibacter stibioxidans]MBC6491843.1 G-D-S-L family lipolytic protein [Flavihumibacter stibioxidans]
MKKVLVLPLILLAFTAWAQNEVIRLYPGKAPGSESWNWEEKYLETTSWQTPVVYNVAEPTLTVYPAPAGFNTNTAVIIAPGGGFHALSIKSEGTDVAKWLNSKGITAFVLKYRLVHSLTEEPTIEFGQSISGNGSEKYDYKTVVSMAMQDGLKAVAYLRENAEKYNISRDRIGFMGFSAGGTVTMSVVYNSTDANRPNFIVPVYAYTGRLPGDSTVPAAKTPAFIVAATDDNLGLAPHSVAVYNKWVAAKQPAELHMYERGGHGFGMRELNLPSDTWVDRLADWMGEYGWMWPVKPTGWRANTNYKDWRKYSRMQDELNRNDWGNLRKYAKENDALKPLKANEKRIVFMGNSITEGWKNNRPSFFAGRPYINRGISGQTTPQMLLRFRDDVVNLKPAAVVILAGINDIAGNTGPMTLEQSFDNISSMAEIARANNIRVVICSVLPAYDFPWRPGMQPAGKVVELNKMLRDYATRHKLVYVDFFSAMADERKGLPKHLAHDEVHPTEEGYKIMEPLVEKGIAEALKK